jgi:hypothetical protein
MNKVYHVIVSNALFTRQANETVLATGHGRFLQTHGMPERVNWLYNTTDYRVDNEISAHSGTEWFTKELHAWEYGRYAVVFSGFDPRSGSKVFTHYALIAPDSESDTSSNVDPLNLFSQPNDYTLSRIESLSRQAIPPADDFSEWFKPTESQPAPERMSIIGDMHAALLIDIWETLSERLRNKKTEQPITIRLPATEDNLENAVRYFLTREILRYLPEGVRSILSFSVGAHPNFKSKFPGSAILFTFKEYGRALYRGEYDLENGAYRPLSDNADSSAWRGQLGAMLLKHESIPLLSDIENALLLKNESNDESAATKALANFTLTAKLYKTQQRLNTAAKRFEDWLDLLSDCESILRTYNLPESVQCSDLPVLRRGIIESMLGSSNDAHSIKQLFTILKRETGKIPLLGNIIDSSKSSEQLFETIIDYVSKNCADEQTVLAAWDLFPNHNQRICAELLNGLFIIKDGARFELPDAALIRTFMKLNLLGDLKRRISKFVHSFHDHDYSDAQIEQTLRWLGRSIYEPSSPSEELSELPEHFAYILDNCYPRRTLTPNAHSALKDILQKDANAGISELKERVVEYYSVRSDDTYISDQQQQMQELLPYLSDVTYMDKSNWQSATLNSIKNELYKQINTITQPLQRSPQTAWSNRALSSVIAQISKAAAKTNGKEPTGFWLDVITEQDAKALVGNVSGFDDFDAAFHLSADSKVPVDSLRPIWIVLGNTLTNDNGKCLLSIVTELTDPKHYRLNKLDYLCSEFIKQCHEWNPDICERFKDAYSKSFAEEFKAGLQNVSNNISQIVSGNLTVAELLDKTADSLKARIKIERFHAKFNGRLGALAYQNILKIAAPAEIRYPMGSRQMPDYLYEAAAFIVCHAQDEGTNGIKQYSLNFENAQDYLFNSLENIDESSLRYLRLFGLFRDIYNTLTNSNALKTDNRLAFHNSYSDEFKQRCGTKEQDYIRKNILD